MINRHNSLLESTARDPVKPEDYEAFDSTGAEDIHKTRERLKSLGFVFQNSNLETMADEFVLPR